MSDQGILPILKWPALIPGPVFFLMEVDGKPGHKGRHRSRLVIPKSAWTYPRDPRMPRFMTEAGAKQIWISQYPDPATEAYEKMLAEYASLIMRRKAPTEKAVCLLVHSFREIPKSWSKTDRERSLADNILPTSRPDGDNYLKVVQDALNGVCYADDSQVIDARVIKRYSERPGLRIEIREMIEPAS